MYELKKIGICWDRALVLRNNLPGRGLTKVEKHCYTSSVTMPHTPYTNSRPQPKTHKSAMKGKGNGQPRTGHEGPEGSRQIAILFLQPRP